MVSDMLTRLILILALSVAPTHAMSDGHSVRDRIVRELREDGYSEIRISRTFLGRTRFVARSDDRRREIVVTRTGVVLRDYIRFLKNQSGGSSGSSSSSNGAFQENEDDDDDDGYDDEHDEDDDEDGSGRGSDGDNDDEDDDDNSGSGSSNSGSGGGSDDDDD